MKHNTKPTIGRRRFLQTSGGLALLSSVPLMAQSSAGSPSKSADSFLAWQKDLPSFSSEDFQQRREKAQRLMRQQQFDAFILAGGADFSYFYDLSWWQSERLFCSILPQNGDTCWICPAFEEKRAREQLPKDAEVLTWEEHENPYLLVARLCQRLGIKTGRIAMGSTVRQFVSAGIANALPAAHFFDGSPISEGCRGTKSPKELACLEIANHLTKQAYKKGFESLREGMRAKDLAQAISSAHSDLGVSGGGYAQFGPTSAFPHGSKEERLLHPGDVVLVDGGCSVLGYRSDVSRTVVFGKASDRQRRVFDLVLKAQMVAHKAVRPGVTCGEIDRAARKVIEEGGFGPGYSYFAHRLGHGVGLEGHEYPYLVKDNPLALTPGLTFSNEPGIYIYNEFGVRIEDCFAVTDEGAHFFGGLLSTDLEHPFG